MACPTCDHTMQALGYCDGGTVWWCPRCGTVRHPDLITADAPTREYVPTLVPRCQKFAATLGPRWGDLWRSLGIAESINVPADRPAGA